MKPCRVAQPLLLSLVALTLSLFLITGCSGGWGAAQPKISAVLGQAVSAGQTATLSVTPAGTGPFTYQWYKDGVPIPGATSSSYSVVASASNNGSSFTVAVTNAGGTVVSAPYVMNSGTSPSLSTQPATQSVSAGQPATFGITASGTGPFTYQWYKNGSPITGATGSSFTTAATTLADNGTSYTVVVSSALGQVTSSPAVLTVAPLAANLVLTPIGPQSYGSAPVVLGSSSASSGAITYTVVSGPAAVSGSTLTITGVGTVVLSATQVANGNFAASTQTTSFTVSPATPSLRLVPLGNTIYGASVTAIANSNSPGAITYTIVSGPATIAGNVVTATGVGTVTVLASQAAASNFTAGTATGTLNVSPTRPSVSFTPVGTHTYGDPPFTINASSASTGAVSYAVVSGPATVSGNTVTLTGAGTVVLSAAQAADANYMASTATTSFSVASGTPAFGFTPVPAHIYGDPAFAITASSPSTGAVTYAVISGPATVSGNTVTLTGTGTVVLSAAQAADANYIASTATTIFTVAPANPPLAFSAVAAHTYGDPAFTVNTSSPSTGMVTYTVVSGPATVSGNIVTLTGAGPVVLSASQAADANYLASTATTSFTVAPAVSTLSFTPVTSRTYGDPAFTISASSPSTGVITYTVSSGPAIITGNSITTTGVGTVTIMASQAATTDYAAGTATTTFNVTPATPTLTLASIANQTYGATTTASATSNSPGVITYTVTGPATIAGSTITTTGVGTVTVTASQAVDPNYVAATTTTTFNVTPAAPTLTLAAIANQTYGATAIASATSNSPGAITYSVTSGPATIAGSTITTNGVGTVIVAASQAATTNYAAGTTTTTFNVTQATPTLTLASIANQIYGASVTASATSNSTGSITYTVSSGPATITGTTLTTNGVGTVIVTASQAADANYLAAAATASFDVTQATPALILASIANQTYGATATASATSNSPGAITYTVTGPATITGNTIATNGVGIVTVTASQAASSNYTAGTTTTTFNVTQATPALTLASITNQTYGATATASATSNSPGAITYTVTGPATITGNTIATNGVGTVTVTASQAATTNYAAGTTTTSFNVGKATPALAFTSIGTHYASDAPFAVNASSASPGAVTYSVTSGPASLSGSTLTLSGTGTVVLGATQAATTNYNSANASISFTVVQNVSIGSISPAGQTIAPQPVVFSTTVTGGQSNTVTWSATGGTFSGNTWTPPSTAGTYTVTATSVDEPSVTANTTMTVSKPVITTQPVSKNACAGYNPSLTIGANYATSYQWYFNGSTLANTTNILSFPNATPSNSGTYSCAAINDAGSVTSNSVTLNVVNPTTLTITSQPSSVTVYATQTATFAIAATGTGTLQYQWYTGTPGSGTIIVGATSRTYTTGALAAGNSGTQYYATVIDPDCTNTTVTSSAATLTVSTTNTAVPPTIITQPVGLTATVGGGATFSVTASGSGTLNYQWYRVAYTSNQLTNPTAGTVINGATSRTYTVPASATAQSNDGDNYYVVVTNSYGTATSNRAVLAVGPGIVLQITAQPQTQYISANTLASFSVGATCTGCTPAYRWYWYAPGSTSAVALNNGSIASGALSGAAVSGAQSSSLTLQNVPANATGGLVYVIVTSTSDGSSQIAGTNPLTSSTAGLFVGSLGTVGNTTAGHGLCNSGLTNWVLNGNNPGTSSTSNVPYQNTSGCTIELTNGGGNEYATVYWPTLISTANFSVSFNVQIASSGTPADGFTMVLADPSQGATTATVGGYGEGIGAYGIPGFVLGFDTFQNGNANGTTGCFYQTSPTAIPCDPVAVPYMAVGQGAASLWENPWSFVNGALDTQNSRNYSPTAFANSTHSYVVTVVNRVMTVTMDGYELFTGTVSLPPAAYLGFTASTGGSFETVIFSNLTATISAP